MKHPIAPKIHCVFKALPGSDDSRAPIIHILNAIWLLAENLRRNESADAHRYRLRDDQGRCLLDHGGI